MGVEVPSSEPAQEQVVRKQEGSGSEVEVRSVADPPSGGTSFVQVGVLSSGEIITTGPSRWSEIFQGPSDWRQDNSVHLLVEGALGNRHLPGKEGSFGGGFVCGCLHPSECKPGLITPLCNACIFLISLL